MSLLAFSLLAVIPSPALPAQSPWPTSSRENACASEWTRTFGGPPGTSGSVRAQLVHDDGSGPSLFVGGEFTSAGGYGAYVGRWNGSGWAPVSNGLTGYVWCLIEHDDGGGAGPVLYAGGEGPLSLGGFVARLDGDSWTRIAVTEATVFALAFHDDGSGPKLHAGGEFISIDGVPAAHVARWDGSGWAALGSGTSSTVKTLVAFDDGGGSGLYVGGDFVAAGGVSANRVARWDGTSWSPVGTGTNGTVEVLTVLDEGGGPMLHAGGGFTLAGGHAANRVARWDGSSWSALGNGLLSSVNALSVFDDGSGNGPQIHAGGSFAARVARWDGATWSNVSGIGSGAVFSLAMFDDGGGPALHAGGSFTQAGGLAASRIARWDGASWSALGPDAWISGGNDPGVESLKAHDDGTGPALFVGGRFTQAAGQATQQIARWNGSSWSALGSGMNGEVTALEVYDDGLGSGPGLIAGGAFTSAGGFPAQRIARWDGTSWQALGNIDGQVRALTVFDGGSGPELIAGGSFATAGAIPAKNIARWNGFGWSPLGSGLSNFFGAGTVRALAAFDDGSGPALFAGGSFSQAGAVPTGSLARWDGTSWQAVGSLTGTNGSSVYSLCVHDDGDGPALYVGGDFTMVDGMPANHVARWDGTSWSALAAGRSYSVRALASFDDGSGALPALYAGTVGDTAILLGNRMARWDGTSWTPLASGMTGPVAVLGVFDDGNGESSLFAGGFFSGSVAGDSYLARWRGCADSVPPVLDCPASVTVTDRLGSSAGEVVTFTVTATDGADPAPSIVCLPPSGSFFPRGTTLVTCTATDASGNQSTCEFAVTVQPKTRPR